MRLAVLVVALAACGGEPPFEAPKPAPPPPVSKRVQIEDTATDPDDGVEIKLAHGHMEPAVVSAGIEPHTDELSACYVTRVNRRKWLGGHVSLHWDIRADGTVTSVKLAESDLGAAEIERCLIDVAKSATFGKPIGGDADFALPLDFSAKGQPLVWDEDQALRAVGGQIARLDKCAAKAKEPQPDNVVITLYVGPHGTAQSVGFSSNASEIGEKWSECATKLAMAWRLPDPKGQVAKLAVRYRAR